MRRKFNADSLRKLSSGGVIKIVEKDLNERMNVLQYLSNQEQQQQPGGHVFLN